MLFNSFEFAVFFPILFLLYWFVFNKSLKLQNFFLLLSSYFFYGSWDYRFLFLLAFSTFLDYLTGLKIHNSEKNSQKKIWLIISIVVNLGFLGFFKYYNFFIESFVSLLSSAGLEPHIWTLNIILPVGISFYTFHGLSYVFDIYRKKVQPTTDFIDYAVFVSFFPLLVAGPIERATHLFPQVQQVRNFNYNSAIDGLRQILWGFFKKIVIADGCAEYANMIFNNFADYNGSTLFLGAVLFAFQIYGDFSGYSDIALGTARLLGFELLRNFSFPYFSRDIAEFWRRWHISLSSWFRDYLYIPLGGSAGGTWMKVRNTFIIFLVSGFWHGANWTFIAWGAVNAIYFLPLLLLKSNRSHIDIVAKGKFFPNLSDLIKVITTFFLTTIAWVFFRSTSIENAFYYLSGIFSVSLFSKPTIFPIIPIGLTLFFISIEWLGREHEYAIAKLGLKSPAVLRRLFYAILVIMIFLFSGKEQPFIYFQF